MSSFIRWHHTVHSKRNRHSIADNGSLFVAIETKQWDPSSVYKSAPKLLVGGFDEWLSRFPMHVTNPHAVRPAPAAQPVSQDFGTEFYWDLLGFTGIYWVLLGFTGFVPNFYRVLLGSTGFIPSLLGFTGSYWVSLSFT